MLEKMLNKRHLNFKDIVDIQNELNKKADPNNPNWTEERTTVDFKLAAFIEMVELIDSTPWKWWKGGETDHWNVKIELIDMIHFLTSNIALNGGVNNLDAEKFFGFKSDEVVSTEIFVDGNPENGVDRQKSFDILKDIINNEESFDSIDFYVRSCGLTANEISSIYIAKYTLNEIRWEGGYALNQYKKMKDGYIDDNGNIVDGVEDNVFLKKLVENYNANENMTLGELRESVIKTFNN